MLKLSKSVSNWQINCKSVCSVWPTWRTFCIFHRFTSSFNQGKTYLRVGTQRERSGDWFEALKDLRFLREGGSAIRSVRFPPSHLLPPSNQFELRNAQQSVSQSERRETERKERCYREKYINTTDCHCICSAAQSMILEVAQEPRIKTQFLSNRQDHGLRQLANALTVSRTYVFLSITILFPLLFHFI